ncbi:MAG: hypothetical protein NZ739_12120, partial [Verrucomicrobiae bacterium]|nr:hypothetical protein [Verrucomicrobiae bacterium]MDW7979809.1 hypothetical protein [Verrucomicrobiales bacterium]
MAYLQLAAHYARGDFGLAVSGYWSPLISWAIVPLLKLGIQPLLAARIFMIASGVVFMLGCYCLFRRFNLPQRYLRVGLWTAALVSVPWSAENVTPDLLLGGIIGFGVAALATPRWFMRPAAALGCGAVWGIAYLCKAVALPLGLLTCLAAAWFWWRRHRDAAAQVWRSFGLTLLALALVAGPWIGAISAHYGKFTVSNSAVYNHALVGPGEGTRLFLLDLGFHKPPPGRITIWEDPRSPYPDWAPWASWELAWHQVRIILGNLPMVTLMLTEISLGFPIAAAFGLAQWCLGRRRAGPEPALMWAWLPVIIL